MKYLKIKYKLLVTFLVLLFVPEILKKSSENDQSTANFQLFFSGGFSSS